MAEENLSELLFKPKFSYPETSTVSNSSFEDLDNCYESELMGFSKYFYRPVTRFSWVLTGGNLLDIDEALANICTSKATRTRPKLFDTVNEYGPGHWNFEFNSIAQKRVNLAKELSEKGDMVKAAHNYRMASRYFAIAAHPNLKGDILADTSYALCRTTFRKVFECMPSLGIVEDVNYKCKDKSVNGLLLLPDRKSLHPLVIIVVNYESYITDYLHSYLNYLRPNNAAVLFLEMPGQGGSSALNLEDHYSQFIEDALDVMSEHKYIDSTCISLLGSNISGAACIRAARFKPEKIRAMALIDPFVHSIFTEQKMLDAFPACMRASVCNRIGLDAANWSFVNSLLKALSLKVQALLTPNGGCKIPTILCMDNNTVVSKDDVMYLKNHFSDLKMHQQKNASYSDFYSTALNEVCEFLKEKFI